MYNWQGLAFHVDQSIDYYFGETVKLMPFRRRGDDFVDPRPDFTRPVVNCVAVALTKKAEPMAAGGVSKMVESDISISLREEHIFATKLTKGDRVQMRGEMFDVELVSPEATGRYIVELLRVRDE